MQETLPIRESDNESTEALLQDIRRVNLDVDRLLATADGMETEAIDSLNACIQKREGLISRLAQNCRRLEEQSGEEHRTRIQKFWNGFRIEMSAGDEKRVALLKNKVELAARHLRDAQKKKTLIQYQRGVV